MRQRIAGAVLLVVLSACTVVPDVADREPWYTPDPDVVAKAAAWEAATVAQMNSQGLLLYSAWNPRGWCAAGDGYEDYIDSHDIADAPAWHGRFMAALAFEMTHGADRNDLLLRCASGLRRYYSITGIEGCFGRSYLVDYYGPRRPWMETQEQDKDKFWKEEGGGRWWRTGLAKNHFQSALLGCGLPLILHQRGKIHLRDDVRSELLSFMLPALRRFIAAGYLILDYDGKPTEFGNLRPGLIPTEYVEAFKPFVSAFGLSDGDIVDLGAPLNGFNIMLVLAMLRCGGEFDSEIMALFEKEAAAWGSGLRTSMQVLGWCVKKVGHTTIGEKPSFSDMEAFAFAAAVLLTAAPEHVIASDVQAALLGLWGFVRFERNPIFALTMSRFVDPDLDLADILEDLRDFPTPAQKVSRQSGRDDTKDVQPLCNRVSNSHYWKSSPFRRATPPHDPVVSPRGSQQYFSGQDYLLAYWMGRSWFPEE